MKIRMLIVSVMLASLTACGGGGGAKATPNTSHPSSSSAQSKTLTFSFADAPLQPRAFNLKSTDTTQDNWFYPGDAISIVWDADLFYSDGSSIEAGEKYTYDSKVYLSADDSIQEDIDIKLFEIKCAIPASSEYSCTDNASFQCVYAKDNLNKFSCTSIPLNKQYGIKDLEVDTTMFLTQIPVTTNIIIKNCIKEKPDLCLTKAVPINLN